MLTNTMQCDKAGYN